MTNYPTGIKYLDGLTFTQLQEDPAIAEAKMEGGYVLSRPRFTRRPRRTFSFDYVDMTDTSKTSLETFWNTVFGSANSFTWVHPITFENILVRFSKDTKMKFTRVGYGPINRWKSDTIVLTEV